MRDGQGVRRRWRRAGPWAGLSLAAIASLGAAPAADGQAGEIEWVPFVIFGAVVFCAFPLLLVCFGRRRRPPAEEDDGAERVRPREPARLPVDLAAVHERAPTGRPGRRHSDAETVPEVLPADVEPEAGIRADLPKPPPAVPERPRSVPPGGLAARCSKCRWVITAGGTPRIWCPNCGADLKLVFDEVRPEHPAGEAECPEPPPPARPPYFHARTERRYRVYVLADELLFLKGNGDLDVADTDELRAMADEEANGYRVAAAELKAVSVEALTFWQRCFGDKVAARLHFDHPERGRTTMTLPEPEDVRRALRLLPQVFGERLVVNAVWKYENNRYVPRT